MIDHPYHKATGEFIVTAPAHYQVISNGLLVEETDLADGRRRTHWKQSVPISSWLYALGVARFTVHHAGLTQGVPLQTWVFPQDRDAGLTLFEETTRHAMAFFTERIRAVFVREARQRRSGRPLRRHRARIGDLLRREKRDERPRAVVHEVAHQWWGNAVTERDWDDVWLSEGFATYFTLLFTEHASGRDAFVGGLRTSRATVLETERKLPDTPVVHRNLSDMGRVLKRARVPESRLGASHAAWPRRHRSVLEGHPRVLSPLSRRQRLDRRVPRGDGAGGGAGSRWFFNQWLTRPGTPRVEGDWRFDAARKRVDVEVSQGVPGDPDHLPIEIGIVMKAGDLPRIQRFELNDRRATFSIAADAEPAAVILDPNTWLLHEGGLSPFSAATEKE